MICLPLCYFCRISAPSLIVAMALRSTGSANNTGRSRLSYAVSRWYTWAVSAWEERSRVISRSSAA